MFCQKCGNQMVDDAVFCSKCGTKIEEIKEQKSDSPDAQAKQGNESMENKSEHDSAAQSKPDNAKTMIIAGFIFGICSAFSAFFSGMLALACGIVSLVLCGITKSEKIKDENLRKYNKAGFILGIIGCTLSVVLIINGVLNDRYVANSFIGLIYDFFYLLGL